MGSVACGAMASPTRDPAEGPAAWPRILVLGAVGLAGIVGIICVIGQFADGSLYEYLVIKRLKPSLGTTRQGAHLLGQLPLYLGVKAGITSMPVLDLLLGLGLVGLGATCWFTALWLHRGTPWFWVLTAGWSLSTLSSFVACSEGTLAYGLCALAVALLLLPRSLRVAEVVALELCGLALLASYPTLSFLGLVLAGGALARWRPRGSASLDEPWVAPWLLCASALFVLASICSVVQVLSVTNGDPVSSYLDARVTFGSTAHLQLVLTFGLLVLLGAAWWLPRAARWLEILGAAVGLALLVPAWWASPSTEFFSRVMVGGCLALLFGAALLVAFARVERSTRSPRLSGVLLGLVVVVSLVHLISLDLGFRTWRGHLAQSVQTHHGLVAFSHSGLSRAEFDRYGWSWTNPVQSTLLMNAAGQGIILNPEPDWSPFGPKMRNLELPRRYLNP